MFTQLHIMPDSIYSRTELNGIYFTFKFHHHTFCQLVTRYIVKTRKTLEKLQQYKAIYR